MRAPRCVLASNVWFDFAGVQLLIVAAARAYFPAHEYAIRICDVAVKRRTSLESKRAVELPCRLEIIHGAGLQAEPPIASPLRLRDDVPKQRRSDALALVSIGCPHRFDFPVLAIDLFQRAAAGQLATVPDRPEGNVGSAQFVETKRVATLRRRYPLHHAEVLMQ